MLYNALETCRIAALLLAPFMPNTSTELWRRLGLEDPCAVDNAAELALWGGLPAGNEPSAGGRRLVMSGRASAAGFQDR